MKGLAKVWKTTMLAMKLPRDVERRRGRSGWWSEDGRMGRRGGGR